MSPQNELDLTGIRSGVFLFAGQPRDSLFACGLVWNILLLVVSALTNTEIGVFQWFALTLLAGSGMLFTIYYLKKKRYRNPARNADLLALFEEVKTELDKDLGIEIWCRNIDRHVIQSSANLIFKAILLSKSAIADILNRREKGKIVLAREVLRVEQVHPIREFAIGLLVFALSSFSFGFLSLDWISITLFSIELMSLFLILIIVGFVLVLILIPEINSRSTRYIDKVIEEVYGSSSHSAILEVLVGYKLPDTVIEKPTRDEVKTEQSSHRKAVIWSSIAALVSILISFVAFIIFLPGSISFIVLPVFVSAIIGFFTFFIVFITIPLFTSLKAIPHHKRSTEWDIQHPFADAIQRFLNKNQGYESVTVRAVKASKSSSTEMFGLVIERLKPDYTEETIYVMMPQMLKDLQYVDLAGPLILSDLKRKDIEKRYNRAGNVIVAIGILSLAISAISAVVSYRDGFLTIFLSIMGFFLLLTVPPLVCLSYWKRSVEIRSDAEIAREHPRLMEAFQILIDKHHTHSWGITSYQSRLERTRNHLRE